MEKHNYNRKIHQNLMLNYIMMMRIKYSFFILWLILVTSYGIDKPQEIVDVEQRLPAEIDYNIHIKPLLSDRCFACHGPDKANQKAGLFLHEAEGAFATLASGKKAIIPGDLKNSEVVNRILTEDADLIMPPPESNLTLSAEEKALILRWIEQEAAYKKHWSFIPPEKADVPQTFISNKEKNEVDYFVTQKLQKSAFTLSAAADKETLIRRVSFDLRGLPPSLDEIESFKQDKSEHAYEKLVDRFLSSPAYGERMASDWLDVARYADSEGYLDDKMRRMWPWRDWVIQSFNENLPYDDFITWQIAGDKLPDATKEQILATAFNRNHKHNSEGGVTAEEFRVEYVSDRTATLGTAFLGLTIECAKCHDHKYDPISQKEYFQLFSFFNSVDERGDGIYNETESMDPGPTLLLTNEETDKIKAFINEEIGKESQKLTQIKSSEKSYQEWLAIKKGEKVLKNTINKKIVASFSFDKSYKAGKEQQIPNQVNASRPATFSGLKLVEGKTGQALESHAEGQFIVPKGLTDFERTDRFSASAWLKVPEVFEEANIFWDANHRTQGYRGYQLLLQNNKLVFRIAHAYPYQALEIKTKDSLEINKWTQVTLTYDGTSTARGMQIYVDGRRTPTEITHNRLHKSIIPKNGFGVWVKYNGLKIGGRHNEGDFQGGLIDDLKIFNEQLSDLEALALYDKNIALSKLDNKEDDVLLKDFYTLNFNKEYIQQRQKLQNLYEEDFEVTDSVPSIMVMEDRAQERKTHILNRGVWNDYGEEVAHGTIEAVFPYPEDYPKNRLGLAKWMVSAENPLTARVAVNRYWQLLFGKGIVTTVDDFGNQGALPSHPELLDWLAVDFVESGWNVKRLIKKMVMSATYRQSSVILEEHREKDPDNILLARFQRTRLPAEMIRDHALVTSGLLIDDIGGESVFPYQPEGLWLGVSNNGSAKPYVEDSDEGLYRRSLYTIWKRNLPPPSMLIFDASDRGVCTVQRNATNTPLQALVLLNDPQYIEAYRVLAEKLLQESSDIAYCLDKSFRLITGRVPEASELEILKELYLKKYDEAKEQEKEVNKYLAIGRKAFENEVDKNSLYALTITNSIIMNSSDGYYKN